LTMQNFVKSPLEIAMDSTLGPLLNYYFFETKTTFREFIIVTDKLLKIY